MAIPPGFIEELRNRLSISQMVGRRVRLQKRGREHTGLCPFHNEKTPSFTVSDDKGFFHCFGCGAHGDVVGFVMRSEGLPFPEAVERLAREAGMEVPVSSPEERRKAERQATLHGALEAACRWFEAQLRASGGRAGMEYFRRRGLRDNTIDRFRLGYAPDDRNALKESLRQQDISEDLQVDAGLLKRPDDGRAPFGYFRSRVMFPICDRRGRVIAFGGRILDQGEPKYLNSPETPLFQKGHVLYGLAQALPAAREKGEVIVCEGYMDVIAVSEAGFPNVVAPLGTALTEEQLSELWRISSEPLLCFDGDSAGLRAASRAASIAIRQLSTGKSLRVAFLSPGHDPDSQIRELGLGSFDKILKSPRQLVNVLWDELVQARPIVTPEQKADLRRRVEERVREIPDRLVQEAYRREYAERLYELFGYFGRVRLSADAAKKFSAGEGAGTRVLLDSRLRREQVAILTLVNHTELIAEFDEIFGKEQFSVSELEELRRAVYLAFLAANPITSDELKARVVAAGFGSHLAAIEDRDVVIHAGFAKPAATLEVAREGIKSIWMEHYQKKLESEILQAQRACVSHPSEFNEKRLAGLNQLREDLIHEKNLALLAQEMRKLPLLPATAA